MSKYVKLLLLASVCAFSHGLVAEKIYVKRPTLRVVKKSIFVKTKEGFFKAQALHSDENGLYVVPEELEAAAGKPKKGWKNCMKKNKKNKGWNRGNRHNHHNRDLNKDVDNTPNVEPVVETVDTESDLNG
ncbi:MAG: hypothetical protein JSR46_01855 [Verrucomicrobia bacterium]|nr:hypothetical protein [Verrucomicrobiota bacterium]